MKKLDLKDDTFSRRNLNSSPEQKFQRFNDQILRILLLRILRIYKRIITKLGKKILTDMEIILRGHTRYFHDFNSQHEQRETSRKVIAD